MKRIFKFTNVKFIFSLLIILSLFFLTTACQNSTPEIDTPSSIVDNSEISEESESEAEEAPAKKEINIAFLKGPTGIGSVFLMDKSEGGYSDNNYNFTYSSSAEEIIPKLLNKELDLAALPTNIASTLYNKSDGEVVVLAVNNFGAFSVISTDPSVTNLFDLKGRTIVSAGQGATPEYAFDYVLKGNGIDPKSDITIDFKSAVSEAAASMIAGQADIVLLPEPFVTQVLKQTQDAKIIADISKEWENITDISTFTVGCVVVRKEFLENNKDLVDIFLKEYKESVEMVLDDIDTAAVLCERFDILKADIATTAIPNSNLTYIDGTMGMKDQISGFLQVLFEANPESIGGKMPGDDFYYQP